MYDTRDVMLVTLVDVTHNLDTVYMKLKLQVLFNFYKSTKLFTIL